MSLGASENLILTGFMGAGKSAVGKEIARRLGREFVDMDTLIEKREGLTVAEIFAQRGQAHFRRLEASLCRELAARQGVVIAAGGGALIPDANLEILTASGPVVCLNAAPETILRRLEAAQDRPLLDVADRQTRIADLLAERAEAYARIPLQVDTTALSVAEVAERVLAVARTAPAAILPVHFPGGEYSIHLGRGLLARTGELLRQSGLAGQVALVTNPTVGELYAETVTASLVKAGFGVVACTVPDGEAYKTLDTMRTIYDCFIDGGLDRRSVVLALGGGVIGDMAGFAAATYLRGVALVQAPTTLLSMVDSSVGGKVAVDHPRGKNLVGAFKQPRLVIIDPEALSTLPARELANGLAETVKAGLVGDPALFEQLETRGSHSLPWRWLVERALRVKIAVVEEDPFEHGRRLTLNLGHTFGHALEALSDFALSHGEGVSVGLVAAARLADRLGLCDAALQGTASEAVAPRIKGLLARLGLPTAYRGFTAEQVWQAMHTDKKRVGQSLRFVLPRAVGDVFIIEGLSKMDVLAVLEILREE